MKFKTSKYLNYSRASIHDGKIVACCSEWKRNLLVEVDLDKKSASVIKGYYENDNYEGDFVEAVTCYENAIYTINYKCEYIEGYWNDNSTLKRLYLDDLYQLGEWNNVAAFFVFSHNVVFVSRTACRIVYIDLYLDSIEKEIQIEGNYIKDVIKNGNILWLLLNKGNKVLKFNLIDENTEIVALKKTYKKFVKGLGEQICALSDEGKVFIIDDFIEKFLISVKGSQGDIMFCGDCYIYNNGFDIYKYDLNGNLVSTYVDFPNELTEIGPKDWIKFADCFEDENNYYYPPRVFSHTLAISKAKGDIDWIGIVPSNGNEFMRAFKYLKPDIIKEGTITINDFINYLCTM